MFFIVFSFTGTSQWTWLNPKITINSLNDVAFIDSLKGYIAGNNGTLLKTANSGTDWEIIDTDTTLDLTCIFKVNQSVIYIGGDHGLIMKSMNGGDYWRYQDSGYPLRINSIWFTSVDTGYAVGPVGAILKTTDGAETWTSGSLGQWTEFFSVCFTSEDTGFIAGRSGNIYKTNNGGESWHQCDSGTEQTLFSLYFTSSQTGYVSGEWSILKTTDGGLSWLDLSSDSHRSGYSMIFFINPETGFKVTDYGAVSKTLDAGETWTGTVLTQTNLNSINFIDQMNGFIVGNYGNIHASSDCGETWSCSSTFCSRDFITACFLNRDTGFIATYGSEVFKTFDGGETWIDISLPEGMYNNAPILEFVNPDKGFLTGTYGKLIKTTDGGNTWNYINTGFNENYTISMLKFPSEDTAYLLGYTYLLRSTDGAETWEEVLREQYLADYMKFSDNNNGIVHSGPLVWHTNDAGETWTYFDNAPHGTAYYLNSDTGYVIAQYGFLYRTIDGGFSWENIYHFDYYPNQLIFPNATTGYACGGYGMLYKTIDGGQSWSVINTGTQNTFSFLCFPDTTVGYTGGEGGMLMKYQSGLPVTTPEILTGENSVRVYPNPFTDQFTINFFMDFPGNVEVEIFDLLGKSIRHQAYGKLPGGNISIILDGNSLSKGVYVINLMVGNHKNSIKILKF
jgi:photosystem II stability/assembly factor-like uncharacterized protein